jgi:SagB-type dehydrogenase family enzyme
MQGMYVDFSMLFHQSSKDLSGGGSVRFPKDEELWPEAWKTVEYKSYNRFPKILLEKGEKRADLFSTIHTRSSERSFFDKSVTKEALSTILAYACGITRNHVHANPGRAHPSGGGLYPIEIYPLVFSSNTDVGEGVYHYNIQQHALDVLWEHAFSDSEKDGLFVYPWAKHAAAALVLTGVFRRTQQKYGERGYRYVLLEAGHIGQNICLIAEALKLKCTPIVGTRDTAIEQVIDIDGFSESVLYTLLIGA